MVLTEASQRGFLALVPHFASRASAIFDSADSNRHVCTNSNGYHSGEAPIFP